MSSGLSTLIYKGQKDQACWQGYALSTDDSFNTFMANDVAARAKDYRGMRDFESHLRSLSLTGFGIDSLKSVLESSIPEERDWAIGEALAEAWLNIEQKVIWPWNMDRDKRNANSSLPGADLIGFVENNAEIKLVLGEVKSSAEKKYPPQVLSGRNGHLGHQIDKLANNLNTIQTLLKWLYHRCKQTQYERYFEAAVTLYLNSGNKAVRLIGVLIRDTVPNELDLQSRGNFLGGTISPPTSCDLIALHLSCAIAQLPKYLQGGSVL